MNRKKETDEQTNRHRHMNAQNGKKTNKAQTGKAEGVCRNSVRYSASAKYLNTWQYSDSI